MARLDCYHVFWDERGSPCGDSAYSAAVSFEASWVIVQAGDSLSDRAGEVHGDSGVQRVAGGQSVPAWS